MRDVTCKSCSTKLGWIYEFATDENQRYKEGRVILERALVNESDGLEEYVPQDDRPNGPAAANNNAGPNAPPPPPPPPPPPQLPPAAGDEQNLGGDDPAPLAGQRPVY